ncbi:hypothetical protein BH23PSE1_BH23PSE1_17200 [soil metagenome]
MDVLAAPQAGFDFAIETESLLAHGARYDLPKKPSKA